ncbi:hypothetical protein [Mycolicibacterium hodleri]|nr:hypothetical protein [Mycolicibacterium hodleri]
MALSSWIAAAVTEPDGGAGDVMGTSASTADGATPSWRTVIGVLSPPRPT